jgi:hypothetical protein
MEEDWDETKEIFLILFSQSKVFFFQGWWLVSNQSGHTGFTPATFLEPVEAKANTKEEWHVVNGPDSMCDIIALYRGL